MVKPYGWLSGEGGYWEEFNLETHEIGKGQYEDNQKEDNAETQGRKAWLQPQVWL